MPLNTQNDILFKTFFIFYTVGMFGIRPNSSSGRQNCNRCPKVTHGGKFIKIVNFE